MVQQFHQFSLRLLHEIFGCHVPQLKSQRQRIYKHPENPLPPSAPLQPTKQHGSKYHLLAATSTPHHQGPSRMKQSRRAHIQAPRLNAHTLR